MVGSKINKKDLMLLENNDNIYSLVPEYLKLKTKSQKIIFIKKMEIKKYFLNNVGKSNAKPLNKIAKKLGFSSSGNCLQFRYLVATLIENDKFAIISCNCGYYYASSQKDLIDNISTEQKRIKGIQRRIDALREIYFGVENE